MNSFTKKIHNNIKKEILISGEINNELNAEVDNDWKILTNEYYHCVNNYIHTNIKKYVLCCTSEDDVTDREKIDGNNNEQFHISHTRHHFTVRSILQTYRNVGDENKYDNISSIKEG